MEKYKTYEEFIKAFEYHQPEKLYLNTDNNLYLDGIKILKDREDNIWATYVFLQMGLQSFKTQFKPYENLKDLFQKLYQNNKLVF